MPNKQLRLLIPSPPGNHSTVLITFISPNFMSSIEVTSGNININPCDAFIPGLIKIKGNTQKHQIEKPFIYLTTLMGIVTTLQSGY